MGVGQKFRTVAEQAARRNQELQAVAAAHRGHRGEVALALADLFNDRADRVFRHVGDHALDRLALGAVDDSGQNVRRGDRELKALAAHCLDQDGEVHLASAGYVEGVGALRGDAQGDVLEQLALEALLEVAGGDVLALTAGEGAVVDLEGHFDRRLGDLDEGQRLDLQRIADCTADRDVRDAGEGDDLTRGGLGDRDAAQAVEGVERDDLALLLDGGIVVVADRDLLVLADRAALDAADADPADVVVVVERGDEHLHGSGGIAGRSGNIVDDRLKQRHEVFTHLVRAEGGGALAGGAEDRRGIKLLLGRVEVEQKLQDLVHDLVDAGVGAVDLVHDHDDAVAELEGLLQHEAGLGHRALSRVHEQNDAVDHLEDALDLAAEVGVARRVDDVDLVVFIMYRRILRKDRNAALALDVAGVHDAVDDGLIFTVDAALLEHFVDEGRLAVVDVGDDGDISDFLLRDHMRRLLFRFPDRG